MTRLEFLAEACGFDSIDDMLAEAVYDSIVPCVCVNPSCDYTDDLEPDQDGGWCPECETHSVKSCLVIAGII